MIDLYSLLIVGTAEDGPVGEVTSIDWTDNFSATSALLKYGENHVFPFTYTPQTTSVTLDKEPWSADIRFVTRGVGGFIDIPLPQISISGTTISHGSPAITTNISGWLLYKAKPSEVIYPGDRSLTFGIRKFLDQAQITPPLSTIACLRVVGPNSQRATATIGPLLFTALYPGTKANECLINITPDTLTIQPYPSFSQTSPLTYGLLRTNSPFQIRHLRYRYSTLGELVNRIQTDARLGLIPVRAEIVYPYTSNTSITTIASGSTFLSGGTYVSPTIPDYIDALDFIEPENFEVIALPGISGREFFSQTSDLMSTYTGFPFRMVCSVSGESFPGVGSASGSVLDSWQHDRFSLVSGRLVTLGDFSALTDSVVHYATILSSGDGLIGLGTHSRINAGIDTIYSIEELEDLLRYGIVAPAESHAGTIIYSGRTTDKNSNSVSMACIRGVSRTILGALYKTIGMPSERVISKAQSLVVKAVNDTVNLGSPIRSFNINLGIIDTLLTADISMTVYGQIESISTSVSIPFRAQ